MSEQNQQPKPKLLMCYHSAEFGGVEKQILDIIRGLSKEIDFTVACPNGPLVKEYLQAGAKDHVNLSPKFEADFFYTYKVMKLVREGGYDIVHSHELKAGGLAMFGAWLGRAKKRVYHIHTPFLEWQNPRWKDKIAKLVNTIVNFVVGNIFATDVLALAESIKRTRIQKEHIMTKKIRVIPNGVDKDYFEYTKNGRQQMRKSWGVGEGITVFGNIGRFTEEKAHDVMIKAYSLFLLRNPGERKHSILVLAGAGKLLDESKELAKTLKVQDNTIFTGALHENERNSTYSAFDIFITSTLAEGFGLVLLEAMCFKLPVIGSNLPILKDVFGDSIYYFHTANSKELASCMEDLYKNPEKQEIYSERGMLEVDKYSMKKFWENYKSLYLDNSTK